MRKNGFTLIELLAVIVILAIIALIAVPIIIDIIEDSKKEALKRSAENYLKAVELAIAKENLTG
ncbi:MAG: prepilin-type N-terminal cleavage/methylation domain-containing protein, partial [bacterium]|nr:prepilin-type N-terminal cleavage/methylation domain-containing protein [bacterium]